MNGRKPASSFSWRKATTESLYYNRITLTTIAAKIYKALLLNRIRFEVEEKFLEKIITAFREIDSLLRFWLFVESFFGVHAKNLKATFLFVDFSKAFDSIHRGGEMELILQEYGLPKEKVTVIMRLYKDTKPMFGSPDGETD